MVFEYELPDVGEGVAEGEILAWHVAPGDEVEEDQVLAEVETDKAVVDLPAPVDGVIDELHAAAGDVVEVGSVVVTIEVEGDVEVEDDVKDAEADDSAAQAAGDGAESATEDTTDAEADTGGRVFAPPNVRRLARELDVDIASVEGSGPSGRVTEADVRAAGTDAEETEGAAGADDSGPPAEPEASASGSQEAESKTATPDGEPAAETRRAASADRERTLATPATRNVAAELDVDIDAVPTDKTRDGEAYVEEADVRSYAEAQQTAQHADARAPVVAEDDQRVSREPYRGIRRTIGEQMAESAYTAPHATHHDTAVVSDLVAAREQLKPRAEAEGVNLTYLPLIMKAVVAALQDNPILNSELDEDGEEIVVKHFYNIGVAVATDAGLMVPVVEDVDEKGLLTVAAEVNDLSKRARERDLDLDEMRGGTFTITNFGAIGGEYAVPIINHPETAILGLGAIEQRPVVEAGEVVARQTLPLSLSIDHRVIDGAEGAQFCNDVIEYLENPTLLLLE